LSFPSLLVHLRPLSTIPFFLSFILL
jgi:hypothetical protein